MSQGYTLLGESCFIQILDVLCVLYDLNQGCTYSAGRNILFAVTVITCKLLNMP